MKLIYGLPLFFLIACSSSKESTSSKKLASKNDIQSKLKTWYQKDYLLDSIPGISLDKWYDQNKKRSNKNVIVAIIDTQVDSDHEDLKNQIWINSNEISGNGIDDDKNGYIDDINGWNFTSNKKGDYVVWGNFEYVRIIRQWDSLFKNKTENQITALDLPKYKEYQRALKVYESENTYYTRWLSSLDHSEKIFPLVKDTLKYYFPKEDYTYQQLDSMYKKYKINDKTYRQRRTDGDKDLGALLDYMMINFESNQKTLAKITENRIELDSIVNKNLNIDFNERALIGDNPDILEKGYGSNSINIHKTGYKPLQGHCTKVAGIIAADRENNIGIKGIARNVKIMPLNISFSGDEQEKDIAVAIRYAVDNGAKIINMSFGKEFSLHKEWVFDALKYAEKHNVLVVHGSGNNHFDTDQNPYYPSDNNFDSTPEVSDNFINVGSVSSKLDSNFVSAFSNYGKQNVDLFAPGEEIYTTIPGNKYESDSGTSLAAPMVSGTAALIWSYYPELTVKEVKQIILDSGTTYNSEVIVPGTKDKKVLFSELSKSGKVLNVYNAMELAEKVSRKKR